MTTRFCADYAKRLSNCKKCKEKLAKGSLRIAKVVANPFGSDGGDMRQYYHPKCIFESFQRARATTAVIEGPGDVENWSDLQESDKDSILKLIKALEEKRSSKKSVFHPVYSLASKLCSHGGRWGILRISHDKWQ